MSKISRKRILIISAVFPPEPVVSANISYDLALSLSLNNEVTVITPKPSRPLGYSFEQSTKQKANFNHYILPSYICPDSKLLGRLWESYSFGRRCYKFIFSSQRHFDVIYMNSWPLASQVWITKAAIRQKTPLVCHIQDIYPESLVNKLPLFKKVAYKLLLPLDKFILKNCSKVITISNGMKSYIKETRDISEDKISLIYNWQENNIEPSTQIVVNDYKKEFTFLFLGSLSPTAAIDHLIDSFANSRLPNCRLIIAGNGSEKNRLVELAQKYPKSKIVFIDAPSSKVGSIQSKADILLLSLKKGIAFTALPSKLPAYMFSSRPIIASVDKESEVEKIIVESNCGWTVQAESVFELSKVMRYVTTLTKEELLIKGKNGCNFAKNNFSKDVNLAKLVYLIEENVE